MKLSPAFSVLLHIVWSGLFGLILSGGTAVVQYNTTNGINISQDAIIFVLAVLTGLGSTLIAIWNNAQKSPALPIVEMEAKDFIDANATMLAQQAHQRIDQVVAMLQTHVHPTPVQAVQGVPTPPALSPVRLQPMPVQSTPVVAQSTPNIAPLGSVPSITIPGMPVAIAQQ